MARKKAAPLQKKQKPAAAGSVARSAQLDLSRSPAMKGLIAQAEDIHKEIKSGRRPSLRVPIRSLSNVSFSKDKGFFAIGKKVSKRTLSYQTIKPFAQTVRMMAFAKHLIATSDFASKREVYYTSKGSAKRGTEAGTAGWGATRPKAARLSMKACQWARPSAGSVMGRRSVRPRRPASRRARQPPPPSPRRGEGNARRMRAKMLLLA